MKEAYPLYATIKLLISISLENMLKTKVGHFCVTLLTSLAITSCSNAQESVVPEVQDLVGVRGSSGEQALKSRGYTHVGTDQSEGVARSYYQEADTNKCVEVITEDGRYQSLLYVPDADCKRVADAQLGITDEPQAPGSFKTVCGVIVDGETTSYLCDVSNDYESGKLVKTTLSYPDIVFTLVWLEGDQVRMETEGAAPQEGTFSTYEGETDIVVSDKTYFYYSDQDLAAMEVKNFSP
jgi:hypothetical protein